MRIGMGINYAGDFSETINNLLEFEAAGLDRVAVPEAYSYDAVSQLGYIAAKTETLELATGILPLFTRTPTNIAMTAAGLDYISGGRAVLGIGASGPQVIEGFHGVKYDAPLGRAREYADICRKVWKRERVEYDGKYYKLPLTKEDGGTGLGKPLKLINHPIRDRIPMALAAIGPKNVALAAEKFEEWQPIFFHPDHVDAAFGEPLKAGKAKRDAELGELQISVTTALLISDDETAKDNARALVSHQVALYVGGMGARGKNFYNDLAVRYGYVDEAKTIQDLYLDGKKQEAADAVPDDLVRQISLIGSASEVKDRVQAFEAGGVTMALATPMDVDHAANVQQIRLLKEMIS
ncbi:LLM class F420-dependent oxidoreductase [Williamsia sp. Leaf354]|uniref:LLM class F420-dependent oxidoreductase n=1 Tax=Williamsia sp. Leaf354 TaxID=1736349 RepID=UPI0006F6633E|nr:LLM class F420-dependent oxidoreductase [Williamsia sp. Leaf354]KQR96251.1 LLM class F420-dependent oxidoreductase [Williamsia sp. Leaf354]